eukprot:1291467-Rhodomonas_salina.3
MSCYLPTRALRDARYCATAVQGALHRSVIATLRMVLSASALPQPLDLHARSRTDLGSEKDQGSTAPFDSGLVVVMDGMGLLPSLDPRPQTLDPRP